MLHTMLKRYVVLAVAVLLPLAAACSDDDPTSPAADALIGRWQITSFQVAGFELMEEGMSMEITFAAAGTYTAISSDDGSGDCGAASCTETGTYVATSTEITMDAGSEDEVVFRYSIVGNTMTFTGNIEGSAVTMVMRRL
jgi:hypothetical protein